VFNLEQTNLDPSEGGTDLHKEPPISIKLAVDNHVSIIETSAHFFTYEGNVDAISGPFFSEHFDYQDFFTIAVESTGHESRLNRELEPQEEEIIKTVGATYLCECSGLGTPDIAGEMAELLIDKLGKNPYAMWKYAKHADAAYSLIMDWVRELGRGAAA